MQSKTEYSLACKIDGLILFLLMLILFFTPLTAGTEKGTSVWVVHSLIFLILFLWLFQIIKEKKVYFIRTYLDYPILCFVVLSIISAAFSVSPSKSFLTLLSFFDYIVIYYIIVNKVRDQKQITLLIYTIIAAGGLTAIWGILKYLGTAGPVRELSFTYLNANPLAAYLALVIPVALVMMPVSSDMGKKIIIGYSICMMMTALALTLSRGGWFSLLCGLLFMACLYIYTIYRKRSASFRGANSLHSADSFQVAGGFHGKIFISVMIIIMVASISIMIMGFVNIESELAGLTVKYQRESINGRTPIWKGTLEIIRDYPLLGTGPGTFPFVYEDYLRKYVGRLRYVYAHNEYLQTISEWGGFSLIIIIWILALFFFRTLKMYYNPHRRFSRYLRLGIMGSIVAISIHSLVEFTLHPMANAILCVALGGISMGNHS